MVAASAHPPSKHITKPKTKTTKPLRKTTTTLGKRICERGPFRDPNFQTSPSSNFEARNEDPFASNSRPTSEFRSKAKGSSHRSLRGYFSAFRNMQHQRQLCHHHNRYHHHHRYNHHCHGC
ncbi:hypothetical protein AAZX31_04G120400 [Glycine max]